MTEEFVILIVDDNANNRTTLRALLSRIPDCMVLEADSGEAALLSTLDQAIHLILLDVQMPGMDGFETARHLQMTERTRHIPIVFVTAVFKADEFVARGYGVGAVDYLMKPIDDNLLLSRVRLYRHLRERELILEESVRQLQQNKRELSHAKETAERAKEAAERANRAKSVFLSNMSHELRTPLNAIIGFARLLEQHSGISGESLRQLAIINRAGQHLLALINDVLEISRIEAGRSELKLACFGLGDLLGEVEDMIRGRAESKMLIFTVELPPELPPYVLGDAHHLKQVLINLLGNAVKYTDQGSIRLRIKVLDGATRFEVADTGIGIGAEDQDRIFQAFYQTEAGIAKGEGTGLGLTISAEYARLMGGELSLSSELGQGSVFALTLPLPATEAPESDCAVSRGPVIGLIDGVPSPRILVADDKADNRELIFQILSLAGFDVRVVENGQQAIDAFIDWQPHFIWMDMHMPGIDGYGATRQIRALPGGSVVKIVALTASAFEEDRAAILAAGCNEMVKKPVEAAHLFEVMATLLDLHYHYADEASVATPGSSAVPESFDLSALSAAQRTALRAAAEMLDVEAVQSLLESMRETAPAQAGTLELLLAEFRFDRIAALCDAG